MKLKKILVSSLTATLLAGVSIPAYASENSLVESQAMNSQSLDLNESNDMEMSEVLTFDELVSVIAEDTGKSVEETKEKILNNYSKENHRSITPSSVTIQAAKFRTFKKQVTTNRYGIYKPTINFYCQTNESGSFRGIEKILEVSMNRADNHRAYIFEGYIYTHLEHANKIHFIVNGDFYKDGSVSWEVGAEIGIGKYATLNAKVSGNTEKKYDLIYAADDVIF
ncbi:MULTISPECIES: hypothetical protein [unclassified Paenibacillus]|uniref:hypothetical protein n=1 Tax=unclassified Paenibacillus TaxID=185978 RepID=UPI000CFCC104|nr:MULTISPECIES: hypothetical protein [unclassified Paenibacillus]PRA08836.1 hypothetical protein CQ043_02330 [Paenibacillus sp. MYb63]PRA48770.1 hypothetical protein CQ061_10785 [Paenibacillus sp. MYb67]QZN73106.1 hypothetical protein K5K90_16700 [Paenibacillus sp. DR312]